MYREPTALRHKIAAVTASVVFSCTVKDDDDDDNDDDNNKDATAVPLVASVYRSRCWRLVTHWQQPPLLLSPLLFLLLSLLTARLADYKVPPCRMEKVAFILLLPVLVAVAGGRQGNGKEECGGGEEKRERVSLEMKATPLQPIQISLQLKTVAVGGGSGSDGNSDGSSGSNSPVRCALDGLS